MESLSKYLIIIQPNEAVKLWLEEIAVKLGTTKNIDKLTLQAIRADSNVYVISGVKTYEEIKKLLDKHYAEIFEIELTARCNNKKLWPQDRSLEVFYQWFTPEFCTNLFNLKLAKESNLETTNKKSQTTKGIAL